MLKVSVIIANYNKAEYLGICLRSCLNQSIDRNLYEIIVVDDASTDSSLDVIEEFKHDHSNIKVVRLEKNYGVSYASNVGIKKAGGALVIRVDADDYINEHTLLFFSQILAWNPDIAFVYGDIFRINEHGEKLDRVRLNDLENLYNHGAGIMFRKSALEAVGLYDHNLKNCEDFDLIRRLFKNFDGYHLRIPLYRYRKHTNNMTNDIGEREKWRNRVLEKDAVKNHHKNSG